MHQHILVRATLDGTCSRPILAALACGRRMSMAVVFAEIVVFAAGVLVTRVFGVGTVDEGGKGGETGADDADGYLGVPRQRRSVNGLWCVLDGGGRFTRTY